MFATTAAQCPRGSARSSLVGAPADSRCVPERPQLDREGIVAVTNGDLETEVRAVDEALASYYDGHDPLKVQPSSTVAHIEFWLDLPNLHAWRAFGAPRAA